MRARTCGGGEATLSAPAPVEADMQPLARHPIAVLATLVVALPLAARAADVEEGRGHVLRCGTGVHAGEASGVVGVPQGDVFCPLVADPKAIRSFASFLWGEFPKSASSTTIASVGIGDAFPLVRFGGPRAGEGLQLGVEAAVFAQFDLDAVSDDLLNTDYLVGVPLTFRYAGSSARARLYHQSSHLGDELLLRPENELQRENLSFESVELLLSQELGPLRVYAGGEWLFERRPDTLDDLVVHGGAELRAGPDRGARVVLALDVKSTEQQEWTPAWSARAGLEIAWWRHPEHPPRLFSILAEAYDGPSPYGQFFLESIRYVGGGVHLQL
jgi:hypothetical protein